MCAHAFLSAHKYAYTHNNNIPTIFLVGFYLQWSECFLFGFWISLNLKESDEVIVQLIGFACCCCCCDNIIVMLEAPSSHHILLMFLPQRKIRTRKKKCLSNASNYFRTFSHPTCNFLLSFRLFILVYFWSSRQFKALWSHAYW